MWCDYTAAKSTSALSFFQDSHHYFVDLHDFLETRWFIIFGTQNQGFDCPGGDQEGDDTILPCPWLWVPGPGKGSVDMIQYFSISCQSIDFDLQECWGQIVHYCCERCLGADLPWRAAKWCRHSLPPCRGSGPGGGGVCVGPTCRGQVGISRSPSAVYWGWTQGLIRV